MDVRRFFRCARMDLFRGAGAGRQNNDANNKLRESVLLNLRHSTDPALNDLRNSWQHTLSTLCPHPHNDIVVKKLGGRSANHDFQFLYTQDGTPILTVNAEFKHNAASISKLPQYLSVAADKPYLPRLYADFFYDFLDRICDVYPGLSQHKPDKETYLRLIHNTGYDRHPFFQTLYDMEGAGTIEQVKQKKQIVKESIRLYLETYANSLNIAQLTQDIRERQVGKVFVLWNLREFVVDSIREDEMEITHVEGIKNNNTIVAVSKAGTKHMMLLRWKNHLGVLYPAWQISLSR